MNTINQSKLPSSIRSTEHSRYSNEMVLSQSPLQILMNEANAGNEQLSGSWQSTNNNFDDAMNFKSSGLKPGLLRHLLLNNPFTPSFKTLYNPSKLNGTQSTPFESPQQTESSKYSVKDGDTLSGIAAAYGMSLAALLAANSRINNSDWIYPGDVINLPVFASHPEQPEAPSATLPPEYPITLAITLPDDSTISGEFNYTTITGVEDNANITPEFIVAIEAMAKRIETQPEYIMAVISFESAGTFSPSIRNPLSGATGLIQFIPSTARSLGTDLAALATMSPVEQLEYVEKYFDQPHFAGKLSSIEGLYSAVLSGQAKPDPDDTLPNFVNGHQNYNQNAALDINNDGRITSGEAASEVVSRLYGSGEP